MSGLGRVLGATPEIAPEIIAFKDKATGEVAWDKWMASTYHDELASSHAGSFRYWFICKAGGQWPCVTLILSKMRGRKFQDPGASRSKCKCTYCGANFMTRWGVMIEIRDAEGKVYYMVADTPDENTLDIKAAEIEAKAKKARLTTAKEIYDAIPTFAPMASSLVRVRDEEKGQYEVIDKKAFDTLPKWEWRDRLTLGMTMAEGLSMIDACERVHDDREGLVTV